MSIEPDQGRATGRGSIPVDSFGNRLMLARAHAGHISIREAADQCGIGRGAWTNWEKGARPVDIIEVAAVVADKLDVDREWLLFGGPLGEVEPRPLRRLFRPTIRSVGEQPNERWAVVGRTDSDEPTEPAEPPKRHVTTRPFGPLRRDPSRPVSAIPATRRRPGPVRPEDRRIPA